MLTQQVVPHKDIRNGETGEFEYGGSNVDLCCCSRIAYSVKSLSVNKERNPAHVRKSAAIHRGNTVFTQRESVIGHDNHIGVLVPVLVFDRMEESGDLPVGIIHRHVDAFLQRSVLLFVGHTRGKVERVVVGTRHEGCKEGLAFFRKRIAHIFNRIVDEGGIVFAFAVVMLFGVPLGHPNAQIVPGGVGGRHVMRAVAVFGQYLHKARNGNMSQIGCLSQARMVRNADVC